MCNLSRFAVWTGSCLLPRCGKHVKVGLPKPCEGQGAERPPLRPCSPVPSVPWPRGAVCCLL